jgi:uncharacterized protein YndB with AHSA1/START domain
MKNRHMTEEQAGAQTRTSRVIKARPKELYAAFLDPAALIDWLPPAEARDEIHEFDARVGGGYRMSLFCPPNQHAVRGKIVFARSLAAHSHLLREGDELV